MLSKTKSTKDDLTQKDGDINLKKIKQAIELKYFRTEAEIKIDGKTIFGVIYTEHCNMLEWESLQRELCGVAERAAGLGNGFRARFEFFKDREDHKSTQVYRLVQPKLSGLSRMYSVGIGIRISHESINITVSSWCFRDPGDYEETARSKIFGLKDEILKLSGCKWLNVSIDDGTERFLTYSESLDDDYDDDDSDNPNWPSKTGNPSGSNRDNNSPK